MIRLNPLLLVALALALGGRTWGAVHPSSERPRVDVSYAELPLVFEANRGQSDARVKFLSRGEGYTLFLTGTESVFVLNGTKPRAVGGEGTRGPGSPSATLRMRLLGANRHATVAGRDEAAGKVNYLRGTDASRWLLGIPTYTRVEYEGIYPGVNVVYYGNRRQLEYDFVIGPGADPDPIALGFMGASALTIGDGGNLIVRTPVGDVHLHAPRAYQETAGTRQPVACRYVLVGKRRVHFELGPYDTARSLIIDPIFSYGTYLGGSSGDGDFSAAVAVDASGAAYVAGTTTSTDFPTTVGALDGTLASYDAFVTKLHPSGAVIVYSTYLGGSAFDVGEAISVDGSGAAYVAGRTLSADFPTTVGAFDTTCGTDGTCNTFEDAFVTKLNPAGTMVEYSTFLGGAGSDQAFAIATDTDGAAFVTGVTESAAFPTTVGAFDTVLDGLGDGFATKLDPTGSALEYSTYLGGGSNVDVGWSIAVDPAGSAYVSGYTTSPDFPTTVGAFDTTCGTDGTCNGGTYDAFVTKLNLLGTGLVYSTYLGGSSADAFQRAHMSVDSSGAAYVTGVTISSDYPTTPGAFDEVGTGGHDAFVTKLDPTGSGLVYSTYLAGSGIDVGHAIAVDASGASYVTGHTDSSDFPTSVDALDSTLGGSTDAFVAKLNPGGTALVYGTYLGGSEFDLAHSMASDVSSGVYVAGVTSSTDFPTTPGSFDTQCGTDGTCDAGFSDAFVVRLFGNVTNDFGITGLKLIIVDKLAAVSKAKVVLVAKDAIVHKGAGTDAADIDAQLDISGTTAPGSFVMPQGAGWLLNKSTAAKYVHKEAPSGGAVKVSVIKPTKLIKVVAKSLGDGPSVDISTPPAGDVAVTYTVDNGGDVRRFCTQFSACVHKIIAGGGNFKLTCKGNSSPATCPASPSGAFVDGAE